MQECEDFLPFFYQKRLLGLLSSNTFPWLYYKNVSGLDKNEMNILSKNDPNVREGFGFQHLVFGFNQEFDIKRYDNIDFLSLFSTAIDKKFDVKVNKILRIMIGLTTSESTYKSNEYFCPHVDRFNEHQTLIYNVNTHTGGTRIFAEKFNGNPNFTKKTLIHTAISKQGSAILFDGLTYHAGAQPTINDKIIININFV